MGETEKRTIIVVYLLVSLPLNNVTFIAKGIRNQRAVSSQNDNSKSKANELNNSSYTFSICFSAIIMTKFNKQMKYTRKYTVYIKRLANIYGKE